MKSQKLHENLLKSKENVNKKYDIWIVLMQIERIQDGSIIKLIVM